MLARLPLLVLSQALSSMATKFQPAVQLLQTLQHHVIQCLLVQEAHSNTMHLQAWHQPLPLACTVGWQGMHSQPQLAAEAMPQSWSACTAEPSMRNVADKPATSTHSSSPGTAHDVAALTAVLSCLKEQQHRQQAGDITAQHVAAGLAEQLANLQPHKLSKAAAALADMQCTDRAMLDAVAAAVAQQLPLFSVQQLANVLLALSKIHHSISSSSSSSSSSGSGSSGKSPSRLAPLSGLLAAVERALRTRQLTLQQPEDVASMADALATCGHKSRGLWVLLAVQAAAHAPQLGPQALATVARAFADVGHYNRAAMEAICAAQLAHIQASSRLAGSSAAAAATPGLHQQHDQQQQQQHQQQHRHQHQHGSWCQQQGSVPGCANPKEGQLTPSMLATLLWACAQLRHYDAALLEAATAAALQALPDFGLQDLAQLVWACASLNHYSAVLCEGAANAAQHHIAVYQQHLMQHVQQELPKQALPGQQHSMQAQQHAIVSAITDLASALLMCRHMDAAFFRAALDMVAQWPLRELSTQQLAAWFQVTTALGDAALTSPELRASTLPAATHAAMHAAWASTARAGRAPALQKQVATALREMQLAPSMDVVTSDGLCLVDLAVSLKGRRFALCADGARRFSANGRVHVPLGDTVARWRALQERGWTVVSIQHPDWVRLKSPQERHAHLWHAMRAAVELHTPAGNAAGPLVLPPGASAPAATEQQRPKLWDTLRRLMDV